MEKLDHLTSEQLVGKFSTVSNYAVLVGERENKLFIRGNSFLFAALFGLSGLIGVYFWRKGDQTTPEETLLGEHYQLKYEI